MLTVKRVERLIAEGKKGKFADERGLYLQVQTATNVSWIFRYKLDGKRRDMGLGRVDDVTLEAAREKARKARNQKWEGLCPLTEQRKTLQANKLMRAKDKTFKEVADDYFNFHKGKWNAKWQLNFARNMTKYAYPTLGHLSVAHIDTGLVLDCIKPIWLSKTTTADSVRRRIKDILDYATTHGLRSGLNPARWDGHLKHSLPAVNELKADAHHAALPYVEAPAFMAALRAEEGISARALEFAVLTCCRTNEVIGARWEEINFETKTWTVPKARMQKGGGRLSDHKVPLSARAMAILQSLPRLHDYVFPSDKKADAPVSKRAMARQLRAMGYDEQTATVHGFRSCFKDWASETTAFANEVSEMVLAHKIDSKVEAAYRRGDLFIKRAKLMEAWATYCTAPAVRATVTPIRSKVA